MNYEHGDSHVVDDGLVRVLLRYSVGYNGICAYHIYIYIHYIYKEQWGYGRLDQP